MQKVNQEKKFLYDEIPYESFPITQTHPEHLETIGKLFQSNPPKARGARVLELGCASGGNLIPLACNDSDGYYVGIDLSEIQISEGKKIIDDLQLNNIKLYHKSIDTIKKDFGVFDYIICHGVYSWVPKEISDAIFNIFKNNLSTNGIAFISYNTLPGWKIANSFREMMQYHVDDIEDPQKKSEQARSLLDFLAQYADKNSYYYNAITTEIELLSKRNKNYILHDHLGPINEPVYFHEFVDRAIKHDLKYLGDTPIALMYPYNLPSQLAEKLDDIKDLIRTSQYMDFLRNQRFRCSLLCHADIVDNNVNRKLNINDIEKFYISCHSELDISIKYSDNVLNTKISLDGSKVSILTNNKIPEKTFLFLKSRLGKPVSYERLVDHLYEKTDVNDRKIIQNELNSNLNLLRLALAGLIELHTYEHRYTIEKGDYPLASDYSRYRAAIDTHITNQRHELLKINMFQRMMLLYMDGEHNNEFIINQLCGHISKGELQLLTPDNKPVNEEESILKWCEEEYFRNFDFFLRNAMLIKT